MSPRVKKVLPVLGWREHVKLPDLHLMKIRAKVDTGAKTSTLHATDIKITRRGTRRFATFRAHYNHKHPERTKLVKAPLVDKRRVKSSLGRETLRPVIGTSIQIGEEIYPVQVTLIERSNMSFRMLLGRDAIKGRFLVDPSHSFLQKKEKK